MVDNGGSGDGDDTDVGRQRNFAITENIIVTCIVACCLFISVVFYVNNLMVDVFRIHKL